jgi:hypothetical protein
MKHRLKKLAIALRDMELDEEAEELEEMIQDYYGDWLQELPQLTSDLFGKFEESAKDLLKEKYKNFYWAGSGSFRFVIGITGDDSFVVKIARRERGAKMNQSEFNKQLEFEGLFPRVHQKGSKSFSEEDLYKGSDYDWIVIDNVPPIETDKELAPFFPELANELEAQNVSIMFMSSLLGRLLHWAAYRVSNEKDMDFLFTNAIGSYITTGTKGAIKLLEEANKSHMFRRLAMLSAKLGIDAKDMGKGNLGVNSKGELMILDSSLIEDFM